MEWIEYTVFFLMRHVLQEQSYFHMVHILFPETLFFLKPFFYLLTKFICSLILESTFIFELVSELLAGFFWMLWMLVTVNKLKLMACHVPHASQITIQGTIFTHIFWYIPMK